MPEMDYNALAADLIRYDRDPGDPQAAQRIMEALETLFGDYFTRLDTRVKSEIRRITDLLEASGITVDKENLYLTAGMFYNTGPENDLAAKLLMRIFSRAVRISEEDREEFLRLEIRRLKKYLACRCYINLENARMAVIDAAESGNGVRISLEEESV